jgi:F-type H+-transporting ATPase subunit epsilon
MQVAFMHLKILLPFQVFAQQDDVTRIVAETSVGSFGILPHRLDCVATLVPGILCYENDSAEVVYVAVNEGVLVKFGMTVLISVRNAISGTDLSELRKTINQEYLNLNDQEKNARSVMMKMESGFISGLAEFHHG